MTDINTTDTTLENDTQSENIEGASLDDSVDPRVQVELERLNTATDLINKLEIELDEARSNFRLLLNDSSIRVNYLAKKLGSCVEKARPYYEARMHAKQLQTQTQKAALRYERASSAHSAAKEMVFLAEEGLKKEGKCFDPAWQEMLNHSTLRVNEAENERILSHHDHQKMSFSYNEADKIVQHLHQEMKKSIVKSRPYFEMKAQFNQLLEEQRRNVHHLEENVLKIKLNYADALHNLEEISDEIHQKRSLKSQRLAERSEGVGAESPCNSWDSEMMQYNYKSSSASCDNICLENLNTEETYMTLPANLKLRPTILAASCIGNSPQDTSSCISPQPEVQSKELSNKIVDKNDSKETSSQNGENRATISSAATDMNGSISNHLEEASVSNTEQQLVGENSKDIQSFPKFEDSDFKFLVPDFNILRIQREELSDSESLASNDTTDTLDDDQIECLLLEKMLPLSVEEMHTENTLASDKSKENRDY